jgi:Tfp pilus assembly protein PilF
MNSTTRRAAALVALAVTTTLSGCSSAPVQEAKRWLTSAGERISAAASHGQPQGQGSGQGQGQTPAPAQAQGERMLSAGIRNYENGDYKEAAQQLQGSLDAGLSSKRDQVTAHKYLAFVYCTSKRVPQCREQFRKALDVDPSFELKPGEQGHPIWGPTFRSVKQGG